MILITGATIPVGRELVRQLQDSGQPIRVFSRNAQTVEWSANVEVMKGDLTNPDDVKAALDGVEKVFLVQVRGDEHFGEYFTKIAKQRGIGHIVFLSSSAIDVVGSEYTAGRVPLQTEGLIQKSGIPYTILRSGDIMADALQWAHSIQSEKIVQTPFGDLGTNPIDPGDIAAVAVQVLLSPGHEGKVYTLSGPETLTARDQVGILSEILGEDIRFEEIPKNVAMEDMKHHAPDQIEMVEGFFGLMEKMRSHPAPVTRTVEEITGKPAHTFQEWAYHNSDKFR